MVLLRAKKIAEYITVVSCKLFLIPFFCISAIYWGIVTIIAKLWGGVGLHIMAIGELVSGKHKIRSFYREDMYLGLFYYLLISEVKLAWI